MILLKALEAQKQPCKQSLGSNNSKISDSGGRNSNGSRSGGGTSISSYNTINSGGVVFIIVVTLIVAVRGG